MKMSLRSLLYVSVVLGWCANAEALINPNFTPIHLTKQSDCILLLEVATVAEDGAMTATVRETVKGKWKGKTLSVKLLDKSQEHGKSMIRTIKQGSKQALLFIGTLAGTDAGVGDEHEGKQIGFLHLGGKWCILTPEDEGVWILQEITERMLATWSGSTDMLLRVVHYIQSDPDADVPVAAGSMWDGEVPLGKLEGQVSGVSAVDVDRNGIDELFIACKTGDRVYAYDSKDKKLQDMTAQWGLRSKSAVYVWADFGGSKSLDLLSHDGKTLSLHSRQSGGAFATTQCVVLGEMADDVTSLTALSLGDTGQTAILVGTRASPLLLRRRKDGSFKAEPLVADVPPGTKLGPAGQCLVADFNRDGLADVLQLHEKGSVFFKGKADGSFEKSVTTDVFAGTGRHAACVGDFDADGFFDVYVSAEDRNRLWQNRGDGTFTETHDVSGEVSYTAKPGGVHVQACDINNDGRQDLLLLYRTPSPPNLFFNRGFRSFAIALMSAPGKKDNVFGKAALVGQQGGCIGDFNGDGAQDMAIVLNGGEVYWIPQKADGGDALAVMARSYKHPGPITVAGWQGKRALGAWNVFSGGPAAFFGRQSAGPIVLRWQFPGEKPQERKVIVEEGPVGILLDKEP